MKITVSGNENKPSIDWSKPQLVVSNNGRIVQTTGHCNNEVFSGLQLINEEGKSNIGYSICWAKDLFEPFNGQITLQND